jgi:hypothetical protein
VLDTAIQNASRTENELPLVEINICLFAHQVGVAAADTLYLGQGIHNLLLSYSFCQITALICVVKSGSLQGTFHSGLLTFDIGVEETELPNHQLKDSFCTRRI